MSEPTHEGTNEGALWGARFATGPSPELVELSRSTHFDWILAPYDIAGSHAHATALEAAGYLEPDEARRMHEGLDAVARKVADGMNHSYYVIRRGRGFTENRAQMVMNGAVTPLYPMEDIYYQAATRGGRPVDQILKGKAKFRDTTVAVRNRIHELVGQKKTRDEIAKVMQSEFHWGAIQLLLSLDGAMAEMR